MLQWDPKRELKKHASTLVGHLQVFPVTHYLLIGVQREIPIYSYLHTHVIKRLPLCLFTYYLGILSRKTTVLI
jgi:hypothetical protein